MDGAIAQRCKNNNDNFYFAHHLQTFALTQVPHHYVVRRIRPYPGLPDNIHFVSSDPHLELPDPKFIPTHAACCRAAHPSGAAQYIDTVYRETEMTYVLAENGSSASLL